MYVAACPSRQRPMGPRIRRPSPPRALPVFPDIITLHIPSFPSARYPLVEDDSFTTIPPIVEAPPTFEPPTPKPPAPKLPAPKQTTPQLPTSQLPTLKLPTLGKPALLPMSIKPPPIRAPVLGPPAPNRPAKPVLSLGLPAHAPPPALVLGPQPGKPKLKLGLKLNFGAGVAFAGGYAGGPNNGNTVDSPLQSKTVHPADGSSEATIMPDSNTANAQLTITASSGSSKPVDALENLKQTIEEFDEWPGGHVAFEELSRLGEGASGAVYKVRERSTGFIMARKTISTLEAPMKQLLREFKIMSSIEHTNIIHFWGAYVAPSSNEVNILMEFCEGGSLESVGKRLRMIGGRISERVAGRLAEGILQGLSYLHKRKTVHRDIKPANILLTREGVVKLCDFGVSGELVNSCARTFAGTSLYMAPERLSGEKYSIRSDVWSTGITLLELIQGRFPFPTGLADIELMLHITQSEPPELEDEEDEDITYTAEMKDFIKVSLARNPSARPTPEQMLSHPWLAMALSQEVDMAYWVRKVWDWRKPSRRYRRSS